MSSVKQRARIFGLLVIALLGACSVDAPYLDTGLYACEVDGDCGEGWGCVRGAPYVNDFCAPSCDRMSCDGICTVQGDRRLCLRGCRIREDGTTSDCAGDDFVCIRASAEVDEGICYPTQACSESSQCGDSHVCLSDFVALAPGNADGDHLYCVPTPDDAGVCPARSVPVETAGAELCLATCDPPDTRCPPGFGCLLQSAVGSDDEVLCFPGVYGVPCDDDTNCVYGQCTDIGPSKQCSLSCDEAAAIAGGCGNVLSLGTLVDQLAFECDPTLGDGGTCVTRSALGFICTTPESDAYTCADDLICRSFPTEDGEVKLCTSECAIDQQCNRPGESTNFCLRGFGPGACLPKAGAGGACGEDSQCSSGFCDSGICAASPS